MRRNSGGGPPPTTEVGRRDFREIRGTRLGRYIAGTRGTESDENLHEAFKIG